MSTRIEYGARIAHTGTVYMHDSSLNVVTAWITEYSTVAAVELVRRDYVGDSPVGLWHQ
jgi:hypothetical protein